MNGKKVLSRLIRLFLVLNLVLFACNYVSKSNEYLLTEERLINIQQLLEKEGIQIEGELIRDFSPKIEANLLYKGDSLSVRDEIIKSFYSSDLASVKRYKAESKYNLGEEAKCYALAGEILVFDKNELQYQNENIGRSGSKLSLEESKRLCSNLMKRMQLNTQEYIIEAKDKETYWEITYYAKLEGLPVLDLSMSFEVYREGVANATMYLGEIEFTHKEKRDIYPVDLILFGLEEELLKKHNTSIKNISMVYKRVEEEDSMWGQEIVPVYKIEINGLENAVFVNAYTNQVLG